MQMKCQNVPFYLTVSSVQQMDTCMYTTRIKRTKRKRQKVPKAKKITMKEEGARRCLSRQNNIMSVFKGRGPTISKYQIPQTHWSGGKVQQEKKKYKRKILRIEQTTRVLLSWYWKETIDLSIRSWLCSTQVSSSSAVNL